MLIADGFVSGRERQSAEEVQECVFELVRAGLRFVQLRDHAARDATFEQAADILVESIRELDKSALITINTRGTIAEKLGCGTHQGAHSVGDPSSHYPKGYSAHSLEELLEAQSQGFSYGTFSPVFETSTHPETQSAGLSTLANLVQHVSIPVYALGGITQDRAQACIDAGAYGVAVLSDLLDATDPIERVAAYREALFV